MSFFSVLDFPSSIIREPKESRVSSDKFEVVPKKFLYVYEIAEKGRCCSHSSRDERLHPNVFRELCI